MIYEILEDQIRGTISKGEFDRLPEALRDRIRQVSAGITNSKEYLTIQFRSQDDAEYCSNEIRKYERNMERSQRRRSNERWDSGGRYETTDIEQIFNIQEGKCYYTGQPLSKASKNYSIEHIRPVQSGGSSWPSNLALVLKQVNQEKHYLSQGAYWKLLAKRHGTEWVHRQNDECKKIDLKRRKVDKYRRLAVKDQLLQLNRQLGDLFSDVDVSLCLEADILTLQVEDIEVRFPKGFIRDKRKFRNTEYFANLIKQLLVT